MKQLLLVGLLLMAYQSSEIAYYTTLQTATYQNDVKTDAFAVLRQKCNTCHALKRKVSVFSYENMDSLSNAINEQVFIKQKMPKGRKNRLTNLEDENLQRWLETLKNK